MRVADVMSWRTLPFVSLFPLVNRKEIIVMKLEVWKLYINLQNLMAREEGQDLIEYALVVALIAFAAVGAMGTLASDINNAFLSIGDAVSSSIT
jgi:pilus assembly protein Flp/PilA